MTWNVLETERRPWAPQATPTRTRVSRRTRWVVGIVAGATFGVAVGWLVADQVHERAQFERAQTSLHTTRHQTAMTSAELTQLLHELGALTTQVSSDTGALNQDAAQLEGAQTALAAGKMHVLQQATQITALHTCLGGVEQALNALSVGNESQAISALSSVSSSCSTAAAASG